MSNKKEIKIILTLTDEASKNFTKCLLEIDKKMKERKRLKNAS